MQIAFLLKGGARHAKPPCLTQRRIAVQPFAERHGLAAAMVAPTKIIAGLGASLGIDILHVRTCEGFAMCGARGDDSKLAG